MRTARPATFRLALAALLLACPGAAVAQGEALGPLTPAEVEAAAAQLRAGLPMRVDEMTTLVGIRADGTEFVYDMVVSDTVSRETFLALRNTMQQVNQTNLCADPGVAAFFRRGGSMRHVYRNSGGDRVETRVTSCPGAAALNPEARAPAPWAASAPSPG